RGADARRPGCARGAELCRLRTLRRNRARRGPLPIVLRGAGGAKSAAVGARARSGAIPRDRLDAGEGMTDPTPRPISVLIAALGGHGGGVLREWIVGAAARAGDPSQSTSIPGVAQRPGAPTYYIEVFPRRAAPGEPEPVFSLYPTAGDVDVILASEFLEAGRTLEMDYASP